MSQSPYSQQDQAPQAAPPAPPVGTPVVIGPPPQRSAWPTVIGIISISLGSLELACNVFGLIGQLVVQAVIQPMAKTPPAFQTAGWYQTVSFVSMGVQALVLLALLIAGILLLKRRPVARTLHLAYAVARIVLVLAGATMYIVMMRQATFAPATMPTTGPGAQFAQTGAKMGMMMGGIFGGLGIAISLIYPVFLLVWFLRRSTVDEVRSWASA